MRLTTEFDVPLEAKLAELRGVVGGRRDGVAVALSTECRPDCDAARGRLQGFLLNAVGSLQWEPAVAAASRWGIGT